MPKPAPSAPRRSAPPPKPKNSAVRSNKSFFLGAWTGENEGEKIIVYGDSGMGKTTLASMAPGPVLIGVDDGGRKIRNPKTGDPFEAVRGIETFEDVRAVLQSDLLNGFDSIIIDTVTQLQHLALDATFRRVPAGQGKRAENIEDYGYHKGYRHWYDTMRMILTDCDGHVRAGRNIILLSQMATGRKANPAGKDYLIETLDLYHDKNTSIKDAYVSWADHVLRLGYANICIEDGKAGSTNERAVFVHPEVHFEAKSRTIPTEYAVTSFSEPADDSIWRLIFGTER